MEDKKGLNYFFFIIAIVSASALWKKYDFEIFKFYDPLKSIIYIIYLFGFVTSIGGLIMNYKNRDKK